MTKQEFNEAFEKAQAILRRQAEQLEELNYEAMMNMLKAKGEIC